MIWRDLLRRFGPAAAAALTTGCPPAWAGPPFANDDSQPTDRGHWEIYGFGAGSHVPGETSGEGGLDLNYGAAENLQLTAVIPAEYSYAGRATWGLGDVELAAKYRFLRQDGPVGLDVAVFPRLFLPTASSRGGDRQASLLLPVWGQKDFGKWSVFGGGGYTVNPGPDARNYWTSGLVVTRQVSDRLMLGAEIYHQSSEAAAARPFTGLNAGAIYRLAAHWSLLASVGPGIQNARQQGRYAFYTALEAQF